MGELTHQRRQQRTDQQTQDSGRRRGTVLQDNRGAGEPVAQRTEASPGGLPVGLKSGIESLSGMSMDHVRVHYNSTKPAQLNAHAYAQGSDIHMAPGQSHHLPHEAWHLVQQSQGRVKPTLRSTGGVHINDDRGLEQEADAMGTRAAGLGVTQARSMPSGPKVDAGVEGTAPVQGKFEEGFLPRLRKILGKNGEAHELATILDKQEKTYPFESPEAGAQFIDSLLQIRRNALTIYDGNEELISRMTRMHDQAQSRQSGLGYDTGLLEEAVRLNRVAGKLRDEWNWNLEWIHRLVQLDSQIGQTISQALASFGEIRPHDFTQPPQAPLEVVDWGDDYIDHLKGSQAELASPDFDKRFEAIGNLRGSDDEEPLSEGVKPHFKGAIPYPYIKGSRRAILDLVHLVGDSVAVFSLERGGSLLADHIADFRDRMGIRAIPNVKVPKSAGLKFNGETHEYNRTQHHLSLVTQMMDTEEGHMFLNLSRAPGVHDTPPTITIGLAETAVSGSSVNTLLGTLKKYHTLLPYTKFRLLIEKQTIKEKELANKPLGGLRLHDPGISVKNNLTVDTIPKVQMFIAQAEYILGEDVGYQVSYAGYLQGQPLVVFDESAHQLVAVKLSQQGMLPRDMLRRIVAGEFDAILEKIFQH